MGRLDHNRLSLPLFQPLTNQFKIWPHVCSSFPTFYHQGIHANRTLVRTGQDALGLDHVDYLCVRESTVWLKSIAEYLPDGDTEGPDITVDTIPTLRDSLWGHPTQGHR